jgi:bifunctional non-homologous end joining protein LigD
VPRFVVQEHDATAHHYDFRLEVAGVFRSWAVPKGPSLDPGRPRFATSTPDHGFDAGDFEGIRPHARRGSGAVIVWDRGLWTWPDEIDDPERALADALERGHASFVLRGVKLRGRFALVRPARNGPDDWLLIKARDDDAVAGTPSVENWAGSVLTGRTLQQLIALGDDRHEEDQAGP